MHLCTCIHVCVLVVCVQFSRLGIQVSCALYVCRYSCMHAYGFMDFTFLLLLFSYTYVISCTYTCICVLVHTCVYVLVRT